MCFSGCSQNHADVIFVLDASGSIGAPNFARLKAFLYAIVVGLQIEGDIIQAALVTFSDNAQSVFTLTSFTSRGPMLSAINSAQYIGGGTSVSAALSYVRMQIVGQAGDRPSSDAPNIVVLITDGGSTNRQATSQEAALLRNTGAHIVVVGVGNWVYLPEIYAISGYPSSSILLISDLNQLNASVPTLISALCQSESSSYSIM